MPTTPGGEDISRGERRLRRSVHRELERENARRRRETERRVRKLEQAANQAAKRQVQKAKNGKSGCVVVALAAAGAVTAVARLRGWL
jgi:hypothetical protein